LEGVGRWRIQESIPDKGVGALYTDSGAFNDFTVNVEFYSGRESSREYLYGKGDSLVFLGDSSTV
jgi:hypothetical protein